MSAKKALIAILTIGSSLLACKVSVGGSNGTANVKCLGTSAQINCDVKHTGGDDPIRACWDLRFDCANGTVSEAKDLCQDVSPGNTARRVVPISALSNSDRCDKVVKSQVMGLKLTKAPAAPMP